MPGEVVQNGGLDRDQHRRSAQDAKTLRQQPHQRQLQDGAHESD
jgi:hypothetical protein